MKVYPGQVYRNKDDSRLFLVLPAIGKDHLSEADKNEQHVYVWNLEMNKQLLVPVNAFFDTLKAGEIVLVEDLLGIAHSAGYDVGQGDSRLSRFGAR